jgi:hypothetical protein
MKTTRRLLTVGSAAATLLLAAPMTPASAHLTCQNTLAISQACADIDVFGWSTGCVPAYVSPVPHWWCSAEFRVSSASGGGTLAGAMNASLSTWASGPTASCSWSNLNGSCSTGSMSMSSTILLHSCETGWITGWAYARATTATTTATDQHSHSVQVASPC